MTVIKSLERKTFVVKREVIVTILFEASQSKTSGSRGKRKLGSDQDKLTPDTTDDSNSDALEDEHQLPGNLFCFISF